MKTATLLRRHPRRSIAVGCFILLIALLAALGGFTRSDRPVHTVSVGERIDLSRFAFTVHGAKVIDRDAQGEPFEDQPLRVVVDVTVVNISDETAGLSKDIMGIKTSGDDWFPLTLNTDELHPDLPRRLHVEILANEASLGEIPGQTDIWLGEQEYAWSNLLNSGPQWSVPHWAAIVTDVPLADGRSGR